MMLGTLLLSVALSADPVGVRLPELAAPTPMPRPNQAVSKLAADQWYIVDADTPVMVLASPEGVVSVSEDAGPVKVRGKFADGTGKVESRAYKGRQVFTVEAVQSGRVELLIIPVGGDAKSVIRRTLDVDAGTGPRPPPDPIPDPKPTPKAEKLRVVLIRNALNMSPELATLTTDLPYWKSLSDRGHVWRHYTSTDADAAPYAADLEGNEEAVIIYDNANPKKPLRVLPIPAKKKSDIEAAVKEFSK